MPLQYNNNQSVTTKQPRPKEWIAEFISKQDMKTHDLYVTFWSCIKAISEGIK